MSKGKRYTQEFKREAVKQVVDRGYSVAEVAERLGICTKTLYQWRSALHGTPQEIKASERRQKTSTRALCGRRLAEARQWSIA